MIPASLVGEGEGFFSMSPLSMGPTRVWEKLEDYSGGWIEGVWGGVGVVLQNEFGANVLLNLGGGSHSVHLVWCLSIYQSL